MSEKIDWIYVFPLCEAMLIIRVHPDGVRSRKQNGNIQFRREIFGKYFKDLVKNIGGEKVWPLQLGPKPYTEEQIKKEIEYREQLDRAFEGDKSFVPAYFLYEW